MSIIFSFQIFIILRKNARQLSSLHCYHHFVMIFGTFIIVKWFVGGPLDWVALVNCSVHCLMYFYYLLCLKISKVKNSIRWKKVLTQVQIVSEIRKIFIQVSSIFYESCTSEDQTHQRNLFNRNINLNFSYSQLQLLFVLLLLVKSFFTCNFSSTVSISMAFNTFVIFLFFVNFYIKTHFKK